MKFYFSDLQKSNEIQLPFTTNLELRLRKVQKALTLCCNDRTGRLSVSVKCKFFGNLK